MPLLAAVGVRLAAIVEDSFLLYAAVAAQWSAKGEATVSGLLAASALYFAASVRSRF